MRIAFDVMGYENPLDEALRAARKFAKRNPDDVVTLVGNADLIKPLLRRPDEFPVVHTADFVAMTDDISVLRRKPRSSMMLATGMVADGRADAVLSAGSTAPFVAAATLVIGRSLGVRKAAFLGWMPAPGVGNGLVMVDMGANKECAAEDLYQFAFMADVYARQILDNPQPTVRVINIGVEANKGLELHARTHALLSAERRLNYRGFIEPREIMVGTDIAISDGYTGNLVLKAIEGALRTALGSLRDTLKRPQYWLGALLVAPALLATKRRFDYRNTATALVIGLRGVAVKAHGSAERKQFYASLNLCKKCVDRAVVAKVAAAMAANNIEDGEATAADGDL